MPKKNFLDLRYKHHINDILEKGIIKDSRSGKTQSLFNVSINHSMSSGFPLSTLRPISLRIAFEEMMFFMRGQTDTKILEEKGINIWKGNTTRKFLDSCGLTHLPEGDMGRGYGHQIRNFDGDSTYPGTDQLYNLIESISKNPNSRRHIISHWNPGQIKDASLPPCHLYQQYYVTGNKLNLFVLMRSWDFYHGAPYNISGYSFLLTALSKLLKLTPGDIHFTGVDTHLYEAQINAAIELTKRNPKELPELIIEKDINSIDDFLSLEYSDLKLLNYNPQPAQDKIPMAV